MCRVVPPRGRARAEGEGRDRPPQRRRVPLRAPQRPGADGHPARALRAGAVPGHARRSRAGRCSPATATAASTAAAPPRTSTTWCPRSRGGAAHVGERRRLVPGVQRAQGRPPARRVRDGAAPATGRAARDDVADRVGRADRPGLAPVPRPARSGTRLALLASRRPG